MNENKIKKVLIIRLGAIGDVVHTTIMSDAIKSRYPECRVDYLTLTGIANLIKKHKNIDKIHNFDNRRKNNLFYLLKLGFELRKEKYDVIFSLSNSLRNMIMCAVANPKKVTKRNKTTWGIESFYRTANDAFNDLPKPINLQLYLDKEVVEKIKYVIKDFPKPYIIFSPGGEQDLERQGRIWPTENWTTLGSELEKKYGGTIFVCGSKAEAKDHLKYEKIKNAVIMSGKLSLEESAALFSLSDVFLGGDSGPLHIASALDVHTIAIMGSTTNAPYGEKGHTIWSTAECTKCGQKMCDKLKKDEIHTPCMKAIQPQDVLDLVGTLKVVRHAELVSASVDFGVSTLSELIGKIHHGTDAETSSA